MKKIITLLALFTICMPIWGQTWDVSTPFNDYKAEGWTIFRAPRVGSTVTQNNDGTVTITRMEANSDTIYLNYDVSWVEPADWETAETWAFTYEVRLKVDQIGGPNGGTDEHWDRASFYPLKNNPTTGQMDGFTNGRTWLCSFDQTSIGSRYFANPYLPIAEVDFNQFHVLTFVCKIDYVLLTEKMANEPNDNYGEAFDGGPNDSWPERALGDHSPWTLYVDRNFAQPALEDMPGSGWNGWGAPEVDADGVMQIGFQGTTRGQITLDYFRTGNGIILDPQEPSVTSVDDWPLFF